MSICLFMLVSQATRANWLNFSSDPEWYTGLMEIKRVLDVGACPHILSIKARSGNHPSRLPCSHTEIMYTWAGPVGQYHYLQKFKTTWKLGVYIVFSILGLSCDFSVNYYIIMVYDNDPLIREVGESGVSWRMGFVGTLRFSLSAIYDFTKEYHLYKGTNNTHTLYRFQSCSTYTVGMNQLCLIFHLLSNFFSFQKKFNLTTNDHRLWWLVSGYLTLPPFATN